MTLDDMVLKKIYEAMTYGKAEINKLEARRWLESELLPKNKLFLVPRNVIYSLFTAPRIATMPPHEITNDQRIEWAMNRMFGDGNIILMSDEEWRKTNGLQ